MFVPGRAYVRIYCESTEDRAVVRDAAIRLLRSAKLGPVYVKLPERSIDEQRLGEVLDGVLAPWTDVVVATRAGWERELVTAVNVLVRHGKLLENVPTVHWIRAAPIPHLAPAGTAVGSPALTIDIDLPVKPCEPGADGAGVRIAVIDLEFDPATLPADIRGRLTHEIVTASGAGWTTEPPSLRTVTHGAAVLTVAARLAPAAELLFIGLRVPTVAQLSVALEIARARRANVVNLSFTAREAPLTLSHVPMCELMDETLEILQVPEGRQSTEAVLGGWEYRRAVVAPTGNIKRRGRRSPMGWPASSPWVIAIGGVRNDLTPSRGARFGGKRGNDRDQWWVLPCGDRIGKRVLEPCVSVNGQPNGGTSFAAAVASALITRALTNNPGMDPVTQCFVGQPVIKPLSYRRD